MKGIRVVFLAIACSALIQAIRACPRTAPRQTPGDSASNTANTRPVDEQENKAVVQREWKEPDGNRLMSRSSSTKAHDAQKMPNSFERALVAKTSNSHQPASVRPHPREVRHTGSNPAVVSGSESSGAKNAGSIDGTQVKRKR